MKVRLHAFFKTSYDMQMSGQLHIPAVLPAVFTGWKIVCIPEAVQTWKTKLNVSTPVTVVCGVVFKITVFFFSWEQYPVMNVLTLNCFHLPKQWLGAPHSGRHRDKTRKVVEGRSIR